MKNRSAQTGFFVGQKQKKKKKNQERRGRLYFVREAYGNVATSSPRTRTKKQMTATATLEQGRLH